jgi:muconolactone delta-isomerase
MKVSVFHTPEHVRPQQSVVVKSAPVKPAVSVDQLRVSDLRLRQSNSIPVTGDLRPLWRVHGRILNNSIYTIKSVRLLVRLWTKQEFSDSAVFELKTEIPSGAVQSFEQEIHLSPPAAAWNWDCRVASAETE